MGLVPDLFEALPPSHREKWLREQNAAKRDSTVAKNVEEELGGFSETYRPANFSTEGA